MKTHHKTLVSFLVAFVLLIVDLNVFSQNDEISSSQALDLKEVEFQHKFLESQRMKVTGNLSDAADLLVSCLTIDPQSDAAYFELAGLELANKNMISALKYARKAMEIKPENIYYRLLVARLYQQMGNMKESTKVLEGICKDLKPGFDVRLELASAYIQDNKLKKALSVFQKLEKEYGINEDISIAKERIYIALGNEKKAIAEIQNLIKAYPNESRFYGMLAEAYSDNNLNSKAIEVYKQLFDIDQNNGIARISFASFLMKNGDLQNAVTQLKLGFANADVPVDLKVGILAPLVSNEKSIENVEWLSDLINILIETHPDNVLAHSLKADYLLTNQQLSEAIEELEFILNQDKKNYYVWEKLLVLKSEIEDTKGVYEISGQAIELFPFQPLIFLFHGSSSFQLKKYDEAIKTLETGIELTSDNPELKVEFLRYLGESFFKQANFPKGDASFDELLKLDTTAWEVMNNYAYYLSLQGRMLSKAKSMATKAVDANPENASYLDTYGWVLYKLGDYQNAAKILADAVKVSAQRSPVLLEHLGDVMYKLGNYTDAIENWYKAREAGQGSEFLDTKIREKKLIE